MKSTTYNIQSEIKFVKFMEECMEDLEEVVDMFIKEEDYQKLKRVFHKDNDYFSKEELEEYGIIFDVILT